MSAPILPDTTDLGAAREWLRRRLDDGAACPCCTQHAQVYRWSLYGTAVHALILFHRLGGTTEYVSSKQLKDHGYKGQGDASRLRHWGLVEEEKSRRQDGGRSGFWRVTERGEAYLRGAVTLPKYAHVYDGRVLRFSGEQVDVRAALGKAFSYDELMRGAA